MKKKIIFFDGDGTLWYPKSTKHSKAPHWIYYDTKTKKNHMNHLMLVPTALFTLKELKKRGVVLIILSTHPHPPKEADKIIKGKVKHFNLHKLFDEIHATREYHRSKGEFITKILKRRGISKNKALMVGDSYDWDYKPAISKGISAVLIESEYRKLHPKGLRVKNTINQLKELLNYV